MTRRRADAAPAPGAAAPAGRAAGPGPARTASQMDEAEIPLERSLPGRASPPRPSSPGSGRRSCCRMVLRGRDGRPGPAGRLPDRRRCGREHHRRTRADDGSPWRLLQPVPAPGLAAGPRPGGQPAAGRRPCPPAAAAGGSPAGPLPLPRLDLRPGRDAARRAVPARAARVPGRAVAAPGRRRPPGAGSCSPGSTPGPGAGVPLAGPARAGADARTLAAYPLADLRAGARCATRSPPTGR